MENSDLICEREREWNMGRQKMLYTQTDKRAWKTRTWIHHWLHTKTFVAALDFRECRQSNSTMEKRTKERNKKKWHHRGQIRKQTSWTQERRVRNWTLCLCFRVDVREARKKSHGGNSRMTDLFQHTLTDQRAAFSFDEISAHINGCQTMSPNNRTVLNSAIFVSKHGTFLYETYVYYLTTQSVSVSHNY